MSAAPVRANICLPRFGGFGKRERARQRFKSDAWRPTGNADVGRRVEIFVCAVD
jgi:hypothetical protein